MLSAKGVPNGGLAKSARGKSDPKGSWEKAAVKERRGPGTTKYSGGK